MHISTDDINSQPRKPLPSNSAYKTKVGALVKRYRAQGVKDWGHLIEGHGGMMDRADSLVFAAPVFFHIVRYFWTV